MVMEVEVKELLKDIRGLEKKRDDKLDSISLTLNEITIARLTRESAYLEKQIIRKMEILRIISRD